MLLTSPPKRATSLNNLEAMNEREALVGMNTVSIPDSCLFI